MEDIFEIETNGIYIFKATTDKAKSRSKKIEINIEGTNSTIEIDQDIKTPRNTIEAGIKNGIETGPIIVTIKYEENGLKKQYKKENDEEWTNVENDVQVSFAVIENTTILARYSDGTNGFQIKKYKIENVDNEGPIIESTNLTFENKNINAIASATDPSGILRYEYSIDGENYSTTNDFPITVGGTYKVYVKAIDNAGNETIDSEEITANDYTLNVATSSGGTVSGDSGKKFENESCTVNATPNTGYYFLGWYEGATVVSTSATYTFKMPAKDYSIVAKFDLIVYTIKYNANDGSGNMTVENKKYGNSYTIQNNTFNSPSGYTFKGWATSSSAHTVEYSAGSSYTADYELTLYAIWYCDGTGITCTGPFYENITCNSAIKCTGTTNKQVICGNESMNYPTGQTLANCPNGCWNGFEGAYKSYHWGCTGCNGSWFYWKCVKCGYTEGTVPQNGHHYKEISVCTKHGTPTSEGTHYYCPVHNNIKLSGTSHTIKEEKPCQHGKTSKHSYCEHNETSAHFLN